MVKVKQLIAFFQGIRSGTRSSIKYLQTGTMHIHTLFPDATTFASAMSRRHQPVWFFYFLFKTDLDFHVVLSFSLGKARPTWTYFFPETFLLVQFLMLICIYFFGKLIKSSATININIARGGVKAYVKRTVGRSPSQLHLVQLKNTKKPKYILLLL